MAFVKCALISAGQELQRFEPLQGRDTKSEILKICVMLVENIIPPLQD